MSKISSLFKSDIFAYFFSENKLWSESRKSIWGPFSPQDHPDDSQSYPSSKPSIVTRIPVEILIIIFNFVGPSTSRNPYPYLPLSWVCRFWRSIIRDNATFWTVRCMKKRSYMNPLDITQGAIWHPNPCAIDFITRDSDNSLYPVPHHELESAVYNESSRKQIRTFQFPTLGFYSNYFQRNFDVCFPKLEKLSVESLIPSRHADSVYQLSMLITASPRLRYMEISLFDLYALHSLRLEDSSPSPSFFRIEWLKLTRVLSHFLIYQIVHKMSNLQILILTSFVQTQEEISAVPQTHSIIHLPKLRILSFDCVIDEACTFQAPRLDYLSVLNRVNGGGMPCTYTWKFSNWNLLKSFDFSQISNMLIGFHAFMSGIANIDSLDVSEQSVVCVSASDERLLDCLSFDHFHAEGFNSQPLLDDYLALPPKNRFHIPIRWEFQSEDLFNSILDRVTNLVELTLNQGGLDLKGDRDYNLFWGDILESVACAKITSLNIVQGRSLSAICKLLGGRRAPRLERVMYHNAFMVKSTAFLPRCLKSLQSRRLEDHSQPLRILELRNVANVPLERAQEIEELGVRLIQASP